MFFVVVVVFILPIKEKDQNIIHKLTDLWSLQPATVDFTRSLYSFNIIIEVGFLLLILEIMCHPYAWFFAVMLGFFPHGVALPIWT